MNIETTVEPKFISASELSRRINRPVGAVIAAIKRGDIVPDQSLINLHLFDRTRLADIAQFFRVVKTAQPTL